MRAPAKVRAALLLGAVLLCAGPTWAGPDGDPSDEFTPSRGTADVSPEVAREAASIARRTMSPFCPGRTLSDCPSEYATAWRRDIRVMVEQGMSAAEIQAELEKRAGGNLSGIPNRGSSYVFPIALATAAALLLFAIFMRLRRDDEVEVVAGGPGSKKKRAEKELPAGGVDDARLQDELDSED